MKKTITSIATLSIALSAAAQTQTYRFDDAGDLSNNFNFSGAGGALNEQPGVGLQSRGLLGAYYTTQAATAVPNAGAVTFDAGNNFSVTQSIYFRTKSGGSDAGDAFGGIILDNADPITLGLTSKSSVGESTAYQNIDSDGINLAIRAIDGDDEAGGIGIQFVGFIDDNTSSQFFGFGGNYTLTQNNQWYFYETIYSWNANDTNWDLTWNLYFADPDGSITSTALTTLTTNDRLNPFTIDGQNNMTLTGFIGAARGQNANIWGYDQATLVSVPEPSAYAFIAGSFALGWIMTRRRS